MYMSRKNVLGFVSHGGEIHVIYEDDSNSDAIWPIRSTPIKNVSLDPHWSQKEAIAKSRRELAELSA
jgi:hypothetical protein